jgi:hypothetical protein
VSLGCEVYYYVCISNELRNQGEIGDVTLEKGVSAVFFEVGKICGIRSILQVI